MQTEKEEGCLTIKIANIAKDTRFEAAIVENAHTNDSKKTAFCYIVMQLSLILLCA